MQVQVHPKHTSAVAVYKATSGADAALRAARKGTTVEFLLGPSPEAVGPTGLRKLVQEHKAQYPGNEVLLKHLNEWMAAFEEREAEKQREAEAPAADDGWTVVTRNGGRKRKQGLPMPDIHIALRSSAPALCYEPMVPVYGHVRHASAH
jgi:Ribosomal RNA-processing protein 7 (RRP7) C-terminal domain